MREIAAFVSSDQGRLYGNICDRWGLDPGAIFDDDVLAHNFRVGLAVAEQPMESTVDEAAHHVALVDRARTAAADLA